MCVHAIGLMEAIPTRDALETVRGKRSFILSRSTFPGYGSYGGHWTGTVIHSTVCIRVFNKLIWSSEKKLRFTHHIMHVYFLR